MKRKLLYGLLVGLTSPYLWAQSSLVQYVSVASTENAEIQASFTDPAVTAANLVAGTGLTPANASTWNWNGWDVESLTFADAVAANDFFTWGFTATAEVTPSFMDIRLDRSGSGPDDIEIQASLNGGAPVSLFTFDYGDTGAGILHSFSLAPLGTMIAGDSVVFTLAAFNSESTGGTFDLENEDGIGINILGESSITSILVEVDASSYPESFGDEAEITVSRNGDTSESLVVMLSADMPDDVVLPVSITIPAGETENFDVFAIVDDLDIEPTESITITASATGVLDATTSFEIFDNDTPSTLLVNEFLADPPAGVDVNGDGVADTGDDEFIEFTNVSDSPLDLSDWTISDGLQVRHTFPTGTILEVGCALVVTGAGSEALPTSIGTTLVQAASTGTLGLNNAGDTITVVDTTTVPATTVINLTFGDEAAGDQSINLDPDFTDGDVYVPHSEVANAVGAFSYGTTVEGNDPCATEFLAVTFAAATISETDGASATTGTVTRTGGDNALALTVTLTSGDLTEIIVPDSVEIPAGSASATFDVTVVDDTQVDGDRVASVSASAPSGTFVGSGTGSITVLDAGDTFSPPALVTLNEIWADDSGGDTVEYVELFGTPGASLSGLSLISVSGSGGFDITVILQIEFTDEVIPADGYFLIAAGLDDEADLIQPINFLVNSAVTYALVPTADLFTENSVLTPDSQTALATSALDAVAVSDGSGPEVFFGATEIGPNPAGFPYDLVFRTVDGVGDTVADWMVQDHFDLGIELGDENDLLSTPGSSNTRTVSDYQVTLATSDFSAGEFVLDFVATASSDIYRSQDLVFWDRLTVDGGITSGIFTDANPPAERAFYIIQEAGSEPPGPPTAN